MAGKVIVSKGGVSNIIGKYSLDTGPEHIGAAGMQSRITYLMPRRMQITPTLALSRNENTQKKKCAIIEFDEDNIEEHLNSLHLHMCNL